MEQGGGAIDASPELADTTLWKGFHNETCSYGGGTR
jgi:hypothetical protein